MSLLTRARKTEDLLSAMIEDYGITPRPSEIHTVALAWRVTANDSEVGERSRAIARERAAYWDERAMTR